MKSHSNVSRHYKFPTIPYQSALNILQGRRQGGLGGQIMPTTVLPAPRIFRPCDGPVLFLKVEACFQPLKIKIKAIHFKVQDIRFPFLQAPMQRTRIIEAGSTMNQSKYSSSCTVIGLSHSGVCWNGNQIFST